MSVDLSQFRCLCCGNCCRPHGVVRVDDREIQAMARLLELNESDFIELYCDLSPDRRGLTLVEHPDGSCIFLTPQNTCRVQSAKPTQCKGFPREWTDPEMEKVCAGLLALKANQKKPE